MSSQPADALSAQQAACLAAILAEWREQPGALLPILHALQHALGWIPPAALPQIAQALHLSRAEVHGVVSFYPHFRSVEPGRHVLQVCRAESCQAMGGRALEALARERLGVDWHETSEDRSVTLEPVYCLGQCHCSPAVRLDDAVHARVAPEELEAMIAACRRAPATEDAA